MGCVILHLTDGFRKDGGIAESLMTHDPNSVWDENGLNGFIVFRSLFDIIYFVLVVIILLGVIQGIIVDSFGSFRDEKETLRQNVRKKCFICGISANRLTTEADGMDKHIKRDHHAFMYVYYIDYIMSKDSTERTGLESYVINLYQEGDYSFLPEDDCLSVRNRKSKLRTEHRAKNRLDRSRTQLQEEIAHVHEEVGLVMRGEEPPIVRARRSVATDTCAQTFRARGGAQRRACAPAVVEFPDSAMQWERASLPLSTFLALLSSLHLFPFYCLVLLIPALFCSVPCCPTLFRAVLLCSVLSYSATRGAQLTKTCSLLSSYLCSSSPPPPPPPPPHRSPGSRT